MLADLSLNCSNGNLMAELMGFFQDDEENIAEEEEEGEDLAEREQKMLDVKTFMISLSAVIGLLLTLLVFIVSVKFILNDRKMKQLKRRQIEGLERRIISPRKARNVVYFSSEGTVIDDEQSMKKTNELDSRISSRRIDSWLSNGNTEASTSHNKCAFQHYIRATTWTSTEINRLI